MGKKEWVFPAEGRADSRYLLRGGVWGIEYFFLEKMSFKHGNQLIKMFLNVNNLYIYISDDDAVNSFAAKPNFGDFEGFWTDDNLVFF